MGIVHAKSTVKQPELIENDNINMTHEPIVNNTEQSDKNIDFHNITARVDKIHVDGLSRTKDDIIEDCIRDLFKANTFEDVLIKSHQARLHLSELYCFKNIGVFIDVSKGDSATPDGYEVTFNVKEYRGLTGGVTTQVGNNEGGLLVGVRAPNIFGRGERVQVEYSYGSKHTTNFNLSFFKPMRGKFRPMLSSSIFQAHSEWPSSGYRNLDRGVNINFGFNSLPLVKHNFQWEGAIRDISVLSRNTSFDIREQVGLSLKSSLKHILSIDNRDNPIFPNFGGLIQLTTELAGPLGGDVGFIKNDLLLQKNYSVIDDSIIQLNLMCGFLTSYNNEKKINLCDKYYLGGPLTLRGFQNRGCGPHSDNNALGALSYWATGIHLFTPLPFRPGYGSFGDLFKTHFFLTMGNMGNFHLNQSDLYNKLINNFRMAYGLGIALKLGNIARLEVNYCFPYIYDKCDRIQPGIQFGIGMQFL